VVCRGGKPKCDGLMVMGSTGFVEMCTSCMFYAPSLWPLSVVTTTNTLFQSLVFQDYLRKATFNLTLGEHTVPAEDPPLATPIHLLSFRAHQYPQLTYDNIHASCPCPSRALRYGRARHVAATIPSHAAPA